MSGRASGDQRVFDALAATFLALSTVIQASPPGTGSARIGRSRGGLAREADCAWACGPVALPDVNRVLVPRLAGRPAAVEDRIAAINANFGDLPFSWWLDPAATPEDLAETLGWVAARTTVDLVPVMALRLDARDWGSLGRPSGVSVALAETSDALVAAELVGARGFEVADEVAEPFASMFEGVTAPPDGPLIVTVASLDGRPAATALGIVHGPDLGIYNVATIPEARRRGLGRAAMGGVLAEGLRRGARTALLESSEEGVGLYRSLGFDEAGLALVVTIPGGSSAR